MEFVTEHVRSFLKMGSGCHNSGPLDPSRSGGSGLLGSGPFCRPTKPWRRDFTETGAAAQNLG